MIFKSIKLRFNGCSDQKLVLNDPSAFGVIYLHDYFHNFTYFIEFIMTFFSKTLKLVVATLLLLLFMSALHLLHLFPSFYPLLGCPLCKGGRSRKRTRSCYV